jgi:hypothetical protein
MTEKWDWQRNREMWIRVLEKQTGKGVDARKSRTRHSAFEQKAAYARGFPTKV